MKKRNMNKIIAFTLCFVVFSATLVSAKSNTKLSHFHGIECRSVLPSDPDETPLS